MLETLLIKYHLTFAPVVPFNVSSEKMTTLNLSGTNLELTPDVFNNTQLFSSYINQLLNSEGARYGMGGYLENRKVYARSTVFDAGAGLEEQRTLHLGIDIWGAAGTPVMAPMVGIVHSTGNHPVYGNYGATIILQHQLEGILFYTLYGHLSYSNLKILPGNAVKKGEVFAHFGLPEENGHWPPHLHFQVITDLQGFSGDYPGVCAPSNMEYYRSNCPDPAWMLRF